MDAVQIRDYCLAKQGVTEGFPFGDDTLVFKVMGKIFCLVSIDSLPCSMNLKCEPERAIALRETYSSIIPGYHMNKKHWNTLSLDGSIPNNLVRELIDHSYLLVVKKLKKADREQLKLT